MSERKEIPFVIRAHHAESGLFHNTAPANMGRVEEALRSMTRAQVGWCKDPDLPTRTYGRDIMGDSPEEYEPEYNRVTLKYFRDFAKLPAIAPILLTVGKDDICRACIVGQHCEDDEQIDGDRDSLKIFATTAELIGKKQPQDYLVIMENNQMNGILTTKRIMVEVINSDDVYFDSLPKEEN